LAMVKPKPLVPVPSRVYSIDPRRLHEMVAPYSESVSELLREAYNRMIDDRFRLGIVFDELAETIGVYNIYVKEIWNTSIERIRYVRDDVFKYPDVFMHPDLTWRLGKGDCEDKTLLVISALARLKRGNNTSEAYACLGYVKIPSGQAPGGGHAWIIYSHPRLADGTWLLIETTLDKPLPLHKWIIHDYSLFIPVYFFDDKHTYRIDSDYDILGLTREYVEKHRKEIDMVIEYLEPIS